MQKECPTHALRQYVQLSKGTMVIIYIYYISTRTKRSEHRQCIAAESMITYEYRVRTSTTTATVHDLTSQ